MTMVLEAVDKYSKQFKGAAEASKGFAKVAQKLNKEQRDLNKKLADVSTYQRLQNEIARQTSDFLVSAFEGSKTTVIFVIKLVKGAYAVIHKQGRIRP